ncbi:MAG: HTTM domain-containing protein [Polyangiaceae bacterium]|nr:HTTM domain-containing protein [Polyangiaceae bacterium]
MKTTAKKLAERSAELAFRPVDVASLAVYRVLFGALLATSSLRFLLEGWVERSFVEPSFFFKYWGFEWVEPLPEPFMSGAFVALAVLGVLVALGLFYRFAIVGFFLIFTYVELIDVSNYLNHYYLVSLLALLMSFLPMNRAFSIDARLFPSLRVEWVPAWVLYLLRFQVGAVYFFAALAKVEPDWLLHGQPLNIWLSSRTDTPILGPLLVFPELALVFSWAGFLNDLLAPFLLTHRRTRALGFAMVVCFHLATHLLFNIGIFPFLMMLNATLFFDPSWPRKLFRRRAFRAPPAMHRPSKPVRRAAALAIAVYALVQVALPVRSHLYAGSVLWHEQGMRFAWRVMLRKKAGTVTFRVRSLERTREVHVFPHRYLTAFQEDEMSSQPDLILQLAHRIAEDFRLRGHHDVEVRADALVSLNGRRALAMIDPDANLAAIRDSLLPASYILPGPTDDPAWLAPRTALRSPTNTNTSLR